MNRRLLIAAILCFSTIGRADETKLVFDYDESKAKRESPKENFLYLQRLRDIEPESHSLLQFVGGTRSLQNTVINNDYYRFNYPSGTQSTMIGFGWENAPLTFLGREGFRFDMAYSYYSASMTIPKSEIMNKLRLHLLPVSLSLVYLGDFAKVTKWFMPALGVGLGYHLYLQSGDVDGAQTNGGSWMFQSSVGLRHSLEWIGLNSSSLTVDYRRFSKLSASQTDFSGDALLAGFASLL